MAGRATLPEPSLPVSGCQPFPLGQTSGQPAGRIIAAVSTCRGFIAACISCGLLGGGAIGLVHTWTNGHQGPPDPRRLGARGPAAEQRHPQTLDGALGFAETEPATTASIPTTPPATTRSVDQEGVVRHFIEGYLGWHWADRPDPDEAARARTRPWVTPEFGAELASNSGASSWSAQRMAAHEITTVEIANLDQLDDPNSYLALVIVHSATDGQEPTARSVWIEARLALVEGAWLVEGLER